MCLHTFLFPYPNKIGTYSICMWYLASWHGHGMMGSQKSAILFDNCKASRVSWFVTFVHMAYFTMKHDLLLYLHISYWVNSEIRNNYAEMIKNKTQFWWNHFSSSQGSNYFLSYIKVVWTKVLHWFRIQTKSAEQF